MVYCFNYYAFESPGKTYLSPEKVLEKSWKIVFEKGYEPWVKLRSNIVETRGENNQFILPSTRPPVRPSVYSFVLSFAR